MESSESVSTSFSSSISTRRNATVTICVPEALIASAMIACTRSPVGSANAHLTRLLVRIIGIAVIVFVVVEASAYLGWAVAPVVAGLGVGGLAVALAARPTIENVIGGLTLFADKPFRVGDLCRLGEDLGRVDHLLETGANDVQMGIVEAGNDAPPIEVDAFGVVRRLAQDFIIGTSGRAERGRYRAGEDTGVHTRLGQRDVLAFEIGRASCRERV